MYKKKIPLDLDCGVAVAMEVMGGSGNHVSSTSWKKAASVPANCTAILKTPVRVSLISN